MSWLSLFWLLCLIVLAVPTAFLLLELLAALPSSRDASPLSRPPDVKIAVLVPAHNEAVGIADTLRSVRTQLLQGDTLLVVADNCTDNTAAHSRSMGAISVERNDPSRRGKGYALDFGVRHLEAAPPDVVVFVDADCIVHPQALAELTAVCVRTGRPVQALYLMRGPEASSLKLRIAEFAWRVKNHARPLGLHRMGFPCQLMGSGMAFPWSQVSSISLATGHLVEDLQLGLELASKGTPAVFCPQALVTSNFPSNAEGVQSQRTRWEHGHLTVLLAQVPNLLGRALWRRDVPLLMLALDLAVPPLALLTLMVLVATAVSIAVWFFSAAFAPLVISFMNCAALLLSVFLGWAKVGRSVVSLADLALAPWYAFRKISIYVKFVFGRQVDWVRSKRD